MPDRSERKLATVLFADLVGSTAAAGDQDPERTRARLERFYDAMSEEIATAGGTVEKFAGDAVMAVFGAPDALEDHAERALHTALAMQHRLEADFGGELALRIGVNTGEVVAGRAREGSSFVSGDAVNAAARLEQAAGTGEILAGERTVAAVKGAFEFDEPKVVEAKGKPEGIAARRVLRALSLMRTRGVGGLRRSFVGRDEQLVQLAAAYRRAVERSHPVLVTIVGDPGVGKTRLVRELWEQLEHERPEPMRRTGRCLPYGQGITYWPLGEMLKEHLAIRETDPPEDVRRRLGDREILGLTLGLDVAGDLHPLAAQDHLHAAWIAFVSEQSAQRPIVLLIEDVHWAEPALLDLIERIARDASGPLLLLATARPDFADKRTGWGARADNETIWLEPLADDAAALLVESLLAHELPQTVRQLIVERAEGNPFFVEEVLGSLIDEGVLERVEDGWLAHDVAEGFEIPDSVQAVLASRIDLLDEAEKAALQAASVIGRTFWTGPVYELVGGLTPDLRLLETRDFIRRRAGSSLEGEVEYVFKHALTREVAYAGLTKVRRAELHAQLGDWLERIGGGRQEYAPLLAHHYAAAIRPDDADVVWPDGGPVYEDLRRKAVTWLGQAASGAISRYEVDDGIALLEEAAGLETASGEQGRIWREIGRAQALRFDGEGFIAAMERSLELSSDSRERAETYALLAFHSTTRSGMWPRRPGRELIDEWSLHALRGAEPGSRVQAHAWLARAMRGLSENAADEASEIAERLKDPELQSSVWDARGTAAFHEGDFEAAYRWEKQRFDLVGEITDLDHLHDMHISLIPTAAAAGHLEEARRAAVDNEELVKHLTPHHRLHGVACLTEVEELAGNWERIRELEQRIRRSAEENRATPCVRNARSLFLCAVAAAIGGDHDHSRELELAADQFQGTDRSVTFAGPRMRLALAREEIAPLPALLDDPGAAYKQTWFALPAAAVRLDVLAVVGDEEMLEAEQFLAPVGYLEPFAQRARGIVHEDEGLLARAHERFHALGLDWHADQTDTLRSFRKLAAG